MHRRRGIPALQEAWRRVQTKEGEAMNIAGVLELICESKAPPPKHPYDIPGTLLTPVLIGKGHILGACWSKIEVIQVLGRHLFIFQ